MFYVTAIAAHLLRPSTIILLLLLVGLYLLAFRRSSIWGRRLCLTASALMLVFGFSPVANLLFAPLENRFVQPKIETVASDVRGIIVLGGFETGWVDDGRPGLALNEAAERLTETVRLAKRFPAAKVVFTGGVSELSPQHDGGAHRVSLFFRDVGIAQERIVIEPAARNTFENAAHLKAVLSPQDSDSWILVTSAYHMPRSVGTFRKAEFNVIPFPVDFRTHGQRDIARMFRSFPEGLRRLDVATKEWIGLIGYWVLGRTPVLFPEGNRKPL